MREGGLGTSSDFELGRALREGDEAALAGLYDRYMPGIYDFLGRSLRGRSAAEDVAQLTFIKAWESRDTLRAPARVKSRGFAPLALGVCAQARADADRGARHLRSP